MVHNLTLKLHGLDNLFRIKENNYCMCPRFICEFLGDFLIYWSLTWAPTKCLHAFSTFSTALCINCDLPCFYNHCISHQVIRLLVHCQAIRHCNHRLSVHHFHQAVFSHHCQKRLASRRLICFNSLMMMQDNSKMSRSCL